MLKKQKLSKSLPESVVNIEEKSRSNLFTWRGQFSPQLIESLLKAYASKNSKVFDPFLGSGTVLYEAGMLGLPASGCEINPAATAFAKVYELFNESISTRVEAKRDWYRGFLISNPFAHDVFERFIGHVESLINNEDPMEANVLEDGFF